MDNLVSEFMGDTEIVDGQVDKNLQLQDTVYINEAKQVDNPALIIMNATYGEAQKLHKQALSQAGGCFETLREIYERKAYLHLNCMSFEEYMKRFRREVGYLAIDQVTFYRKLDHKKVATTLSEAGVDTRNLTQQQSALLKRVPVEKLPEVYKKAQELSNAEPPQGKAGEFHHPGKVYLEKLEEAIAEVKDPFEGPNDPADDTEESEVEVPDFFSASNRQKLLNDAKPLPPPPLTETTTPTTEDADPEPERLAFVCLTRYTSGGDDFLLIRGDDGYTEYEIPVRVSDVRQLL